MKLIDKAYYWVKVYKSDDWEIGRYKEFDETMRFTSCGFKKASECFEIALNEIKI